MGPAYGRILAPALYSFIFYEITEERYTAEGLPTPLAPLFNSSLISGVMSTLWKSANITPERKGDKMECVENYRSISLLPIPANCLLMMAVD